MKSFLKTILTKYEIILLLVLASVLRFYFLDNKPPHHDEAINGWFVNKMWEDGFFNYDPTNYHGPFLFYLFQLGRFFFGYGISPMRAMTALFNLFTIVFVLYWFFKNKINRPDQFFSTASTERWICWALAFSPAMIFYSRSAIHESFFVFFQIIFFAGCINTLFAEEKSHRQSGFIYLIIGAFGCLANKETFILNVIATLVACMIIFSKSFMKPAKLGKEVMNTARVYFAESKIQKVFYLTLAFFVLLYSGFGRDLHSLADFFNAFLPWTKTGVAGAGHNKPFIFWAELIFRYESYALVGMILCISLFMNVKTRTKWTSVFALILGLIYSAIPYKTPWCLMSIVWPFMAVLGFVVEDFSGLGESKTIEKSKSKSNKEKLKNEIRSDNWGLVLNNKIFATVFLVLPIFSAVYWIYVTSIRSPIDMKHPFVYVQTQYDVNGIIANLNNSINPLKLHQKILISTEEGWPFPWILENYSAVVYQPIRLVTDLDFVDVSVGLVDEGQETVFDKRLMGEFWKCKVQIRDSRIDAFIYFNKKDFPTIEELKPEFYVAGESR